MKLLACLFIVALSAYIGRLLSKRALHRLDFFREYQSSVIFLSDRIVGMNLELCKALESCGGVFLREHFTRCSYMLKDAPQLRFASIWNRSLERSHCSFLTKEDVNILAAGGEAIESLCMNPSEKQAGTYIKRLSLFLDEMEQEKRRKCKLYNATGTLAGLLVALLIV